MRSINQPYEQRLTTIPRLVIGLVATLLAVSTVATAARADHGYVEITVAIDTVVKQPEGSVIELGSAEVPEEFADHSCEVTAHAENQSSVHEGNDLLVESGSSSVVLSDVEREPGAVTDAKQPLELGEIVTVSLMMGPDATFSAGIDVLVECFPAETTTTADVSDTEVTTTAPSEPTTSEAVSDTEATSPPSTDEVMGTEVLPFTGAEDDLSVLLAVGLIALGTLLVASTRRARDR